MKITVFTPTYNRAYCLERLYKSLKKQTFKDFEWVVVDDGSTDNTENLIQKFIKEAPFFPIKYYKKENGGKHTAINYGVYKLNSYLTFIVDSDDFLPKDSLENINIIEESIKEKEKFAGVCGLISHFDGKKIGDSFNDDFKDLTSIEFRQQGGSGDKAEVFYTDILKKYPFPLFDGEKFVTESIVWNKIAKDGLKLRYFNKCVYLCEYLDDGLTKAGWSLYAKNPKQWAYYIYDSYSIDNSNLKLYNFSIQVYIYYLYEKKSLSKKQMSEYLNISQVKFNYLISIQKFIDLIRNIIHKKPIKEIYK